MMWIYDLSYSQLKKILIENNLSHYSADQIFLWLYRRQVFDIDRWTNISKTHREALKKTFDIRINQIIEIITDDQGTKKLLIELNDGEKVESVLIKEKSHYTFCLSSQVGCPLNCAFCRTGKMGFVRNLSSGEIVSQVLLLKQVMGEYRGKLNLVFMGMGEPFLNYDNLITALEIMTSGSGIAVSPRNITVSTAGILNKIQLFEKRFPGIKISFSLNASDAESRKQIMPVSRQEGLSELLEYFKKKPRKHRITFEYVLLKGINDSPEDARLVAALVKGIACKINIIPFNPFEGAGFRTPEENTVHAFADGLYSRGLTVMVRWSKGRSIQSACGQLAIENRERAKA